MAMTAAVVRSVGGQQMGSKKSERGTVVLTQRDRELLVHLALARYLSAEQIGRVVFAGKSDSIVRRRLCRLASGKHAYVRRLPFRTRDGVRTVAWTLRPLGYMAARNLFSAIPDRPTHDPRAEFLERELRLNEVYVELAAAAGHEKLAFDRRPFRWLTSDSVRLPWTDLAKETSSPANRLICPDATVELLQARRRIFIEFETGLLGFHRGGIPDRDVLREKIDRYARFVLVPLSTLLNETCYTRTFPDGWPVELLCLVPSAARRDADREACRGHMAAYERSSTVHDPRADYRRGPSLALQRRGALLRVGLGRGHRYDD